MAQQHSFDWWADRLPGRPAARRAAVPAQAGPSAPAAGAREASAPAVPAQGTADAAGVPGAADAAEVYRAVQSSEAFARIRRDHRGFVLPATALFLGWYLLYLVAQAAAPEMMRRQLVGPLNVAWVLALGQFASTFLLTWRYARNARTKRDRAALELRWDTQDRLR
ncbi:DUF485 domain-containing protein [Streptomyces sp. NRRL B-24484]|uniref:DUF485 domain-containing protein n=1 Tax=Streptomyces sp. NRRL B-24484 TaxID=1463833 RepID=UPI000AE07B8E|nr:DUF485 domain-containing protein [Streptomyces sp. NRRL B-24484]